MDCSLTFHCSLVDVDKNTPLFFAAEGGHLPCVALLMVNINVNCLTVYDT